MMPARQSTGRIRGRQPFGRVLLCAIVALAAAAGPLGQLLRLAEVPASDKQTVAARYKIVLAGLDQRTAKVDATQPARQQSKAPRLLKPVTDLWDTAFAPNWSVDAPVATQICGFENTDAPLSYTLRLTYYSHDPPPLRSRGPPTLV